MAATSRALRRFVAVGDSFTEGLDDLRANGVPRGWADRVADVLSQTEPDFQYANLAVRSLRIDAILTDQVPAAVAMQPDLVTIAAGGNDLLGLRADVSHAAARLENAVALLATSNAVTVVFAGFDPRFRLPSGRLLAGRTAAYNAAIAVIADRYGAILIDLWAMPALADARLWSPDRLHLSATGHLHLAGVVLDRLGRPTPPGWPLQLGPLESPPRLRAYAEDVSWGRRHLFPWVVRKVRGRAAGDGHSAKRPDLAPWIPESCGSGQKQTQTR